VKVAILAVGVGSRIQEEREIKPKPMVEIGGARRDPTSSWR
jgi:NDP-sugar pyrophosphorylase family protein